MSRWALHYVQETSPTNEYMYIYVYTAPNINILFDVMGCHGTHCESIHYARVMNNMKPYIYEDTFTTANLQPITGTCILARCKVTNSYFFINCIYLPRITHALKALNVFLKKQFWCKPILHDL